MTYTLWDALKDFLGALGALLISIPWFRDFFLRGKKRAAQALPVAEGFVKTLQAEVVSAFAARIETPRFADLAWTVVGLVCIFSSFAIALTRGILEMLRQ